MPRTPTQLSDATLRLALARGLGPVTLHRLRRAFDSDEAIVTATHRQLRCLDGFGRASATALVAAMRDAEPALERDRMTALGVCMIAAGDVDYPPLLALIQDPPAFLWIRGTLKESDCRAVAVVGSRKCTTYGEQQAHRFASALATAGLAIVSGGAVGIDAAAHRGALSVQGRTIAVLGCGLSQPYPRPHRRLFDDVVSSGAALISEFAMDTPPVAGNFPRRNRIISGMSLGVLLVEAASRGGALITARLAADDHGREVMAVPGRIDSLMSRGALEAIREGWAGLVVTPNDVLQQLQSSRQLLLAASTTGQDLQSGLAAVDESVDAPTLRTVSRAELPETQREVVNALAADHGGSQSPVAVEAIINKTGLAAHQVNVALTMLEIEGAIRNGPMGVTIASGVRFT